MLTYDSYSLFSFFWLKYPVKWLITFICMLEAIQFFRKLCLFLWVFVCLEYTVVPMLFCLDEYKVVDYLAYFKQDYIHILLVEQACFLNIFHEWHQSDHVKWTSNPSWLGCFSLHLHLFHYFRMAFFPSDQFSNKKHYVWRFSKAASRFSFFFCRNPFHCLIFGLPQIALQLKFFS